MTRRKIATCTIMAVCIFSLLAQVSAAQQDKTTPQQGTQQNKTTPQQGNKNKQDSSSNVTGGSSTEQNRAAGSSQNSTSSGNTGAVSAAGDSSTLNGLDKRFIMEVAHSGMAEVALGRLAAERASSEKVKSFGQRMVDDHSRANSEIMQLASAKGITLPAAGDAMASHGAGSGTQGAKTSTTTKTQDATGSQSQSSSQSEGETQSQNITKSKDQGAIVKSESRDSRPQDQSSAGTGSQNTQAAAKLDPKHQHLINRLSRLSGAEFDRQYMREMVKDHSEAVALFQREASRGNDPDVKAWAAKMLPTIQEHERMAREILQGIKQDPSKGSAASGNRSGSM